MTELIRQLEEKYTQKSQQQVEALHKETSEKETQMAEEKTEKETSTRRKQKAEVSNWK